jgi:membrane-bound lytic murein transglycosylase MltF
MTRQNGNSFNAFVLDREQNPRRHEIWARCKYLSRLVERDKWIAPLKRGFIREPYIQKLGANNGGHMSSMMFRNLRLQTHRLAIVAGVALACTLFAGPSYAAAEAKPSPGTPQREKLTISPEEAMKPWTGDLDGMIERRVIRILTVYIKTFYFVDKGVQRGGAYDAGRLFVEDLNKKLAKGKKQKHLKVQAVFISVNRGELLPALAAGKGDIAMSSLGVTEERQKLVDFSSPVYPNVSELVVSGPASPAVSSVDDLAGKEVFVRRSSTHYESLAALNRRFATEKKSAVVIKEAPETLEDEDLIEMVNAGLIPLTVSADFLANFWKQVFPKIRVHVGVALRTGGDIAWAIRKESPQLKAAVDDFVARHGKGTAVGNEVMARYLKSAKYVKDAGSEAERRKFLALIQYFQKYGDNYDVDWLLMAAQGYQESQLNQAARSPVGAIGVMQVMPATGKDLGVGDIAEVEPNIHAGVKYMRWMIDEYYGQEPMTKLDKALFAFASYNAGAGRISQMRKEAAKRGLDPNVWFHNVEYVAAEKIGAETVTYVANIYKYYIAYRLIMDARAEREKAKEEVEKKSDSSR